jgi:phosphohistidine swiveling domain-containing protein
MNDRTRGILVKSVPGLGSGLCAISVALFSGIKSIGLILLFCSMAGMAGNLGFTWLVTRWAKWDKKRSLAQPGLSVYRLMQLPEEEMKSAGGKGRSLAKMSQAGVPVPEGLVILPSAFLEDELTNDARTVLLDEVNHLRSKGKSILFAVRSSALSEDSAQASFAGEFDSILHVQSDEALFQAFRDVRASRHSQRVQAYIQVQGVQEHQEMAVIVQRQIDPEYAGVLFTVDPLSGDLNRMTGNAVAGLGDKLVSGEANASDFSFKRPGGIYNGFAALQPSAKRLYFSAIEIEQLYSSPQDIEWGLQQGKVWILQARPISTLNGNSPTAGIRNDTLLGNFLWSATNLSEAFPEVMTPFTASLPAYLMKHGGPTLMVKGYPLNGVIGGRNYSNLSVQISAFAPMFGGNARRAYQEMASWWGDIPETLGIPLIPLEKGEWLRDVLPTVLQTNGQFGKYRKSLPGYLAANQQRCAVLIKQIDETQTPGSLADLWVLQIRPYYRDTLYYLIAVSTGEQIRLEKDLKKLVGAEDANALLSNLSGENAELESLGPVMGLEKLRHGELSEEQYLALYGHRGVNEGECAWPRPIEQPDWLEKMLAVDNNPDLDLQAMLDKQQAAAQAAWQRLLSQYPRKAARLKKRLQQVSMAAQRREKVRSEAVRGNRVIRAFALQAAKLCGLGEDVFYLSIEEVLAVLGGDAQSLKVIPRRKEVYQLHADLPIYPAMICGRFDAQTWAKQEHRRFDLFDGCRTDPAPIPLADEKVIHGFAGALGVVEGTVRRLDHLRESDQLKAGEILVTTLTNIGWTPIFPRAAAIITDLGAPLSHAAIVARELGIPAVVGCGDATVRLNTGDRVRVDGGRGLVEILERK